ncbi:hypothetical protein ACS0TY_001156 [Phlomoides rotata]
MATQVNTKVRLVKCPKCLKLLAELPGISVYKCGGCGTVLQAKFRKLETNNSVLSSQETVSASRSQHDDVSNQDLTRSPKVESSSDRSASDGISSSQDLSSPPSEESSLQVKESPECNPLDQDPEGYQSGLHEDNGEETADPSFSNELSSSSVIIHEDESYAPEASEHVDNRADLNEDEESRRVLEDGDNLVDEVQNLSEHDQSALPDRVRDNCAASENDEKSSDQSGELAHEKGVENDVTPRGGESIRAPRSPLNGSLVSFYLSTDDEHLDHSPGRPARNFERFSSIDTLGSLHHADLNSELNFGHGNFPTNGSYYDGSESSYDGTDYQIRDHVSHPSRKNRSLDHMRTSEVLRKDSFRGNNHTMQSSHWNQGTSTATNRYNTGHRTRFDNRDDVSGVPFTSRNSGYQHNLRPPRPGFNLRDPPLYSDPEKIDLLRTVCELKDQLSRMQFPKVTSNQRFPDGKFSAFHHDRMPPDHNPVKVCGERCNISRMAFSGEAAHYRRPISCSCLHYSAQLPSCSMHCKNGHHVVHTDFNSYSSPSPHHYTSSELSLHGSETQRLDEMKRLHLREKHQTAKRHLRPVAGGAPVVACYHCWEVLQLPVDFLLFKKRYHKLMCNGCKKVLKFSLQKGTHIVPYNDAPAPPPSEADDFSNARNLDPPSHSSSCHHVDPVSYSDDYGRSFCRSCSTEEEALGVVPSSDRAQRNLYHRKMSSESSHQPMEVRKMKGVLMDSSNSVESVGPSSRTPKLRKFTSEIEEVAPSSTSPLHRLMGYPSPSHVLSR